MLILEPPTRLPRITAIFLQFTFDKVKPRNRPRFRLDNLVPFAILLPMSDLLNQNIVLSLNQSWQVIGIRSVRDSITFLCSLSHGEPPGYALDMEMDGDDLVFANPVTWDRWVELEVRPTDLFIQAAHSRIRCPTVVIAKNFNRLPFKRPRWSIGSVHERDKLICGYTGKKLTRADATVDHILPRSRGGTDSWRNTISCHRSVNTFKADRTPEEAGLKLLRTPTEPPSLPVSALITEAKHPTWKPFLVVR